MAASGGRPRSPDGRRIAYFGSDGPSIDLYVIGADGSGETRLTSGVIGTQHAGPAFSPDGTRVAFLSTRDGNFDIYVMAVDGSGQTNATRLASGDSDPDWAPVISRGPGILVPGAAGATPSICPRGTSASVRCYRDARRRLALVGTARAERLVGSPGADRIWAFGGADVIHALGGADVVAGGAGNEVVSGGRGPDRLGCGTGAHDRAVRDRADIVARRCERASGRRR